MKRIKTLSKETRGLYSSLLRSLFLCFVALVAIATATAAWFVNNTSVQSGSSSVSANNKVIRLASAGYRQTVEEDILMLSPGNDISYDGKNYFYTDSKEIALRMDANDYVIYPGASGTVEFYVIPIEDGPLSFEVELVLNGYDEEGHKVDDDILNRLINGHILLFGNYDNGIYSDWMFDIQTGVNKKQISLPEDAKKDVPYKFSVYWIWPLRYENLIGGLVGNDSNLIEYVGSQKNNLNQINNQYVYYSNIFISKKQNLDNDNDFDDGYNLADEYIGSNAEYLYLSIKRG